MEWYFALPLAILAGLAWAVREYIANRITDYLLSTGKEDDDTKA